MVIAINNGSGVPIEKVRITKDGDIEVKDPTAGVILRSVNNTPYRIVVGNTGALEAIPPNSSHHAGYNNATYNIRNCWCT